MSAFESFDIWEFNLEHLGEMTVDGRLAGRDGDRHPAEAIRVSDERRGGVFHVYVLSADSETGERVVLGRRFDGDEPQLVTPRTETASFRLTAGIRPTDDGWSMQFGIAGPWRGPGEGWTIAGAERADQALEPVGGTSGLLALLDHVPGVEATRLEPGRRGMRLVFSGDSIAGPVAFWCMSRLLPLQTAQRGSTGLLPDAP